MFRAQIFLNTRDLRPVTDHMDLFQLLYQDRNERAVLRTRRGRKGAAGTSSECVKVKNWRPSVPSSTEESDDRKVKYQVGYGCVIQASEQREEAEDKMRWKTMVEVAETLPKDAATTQAETTAAAEAAKAVCCLKNLAFSVLTLMDI